MRLDRWGRIYLPVRLRRMLGAARFTAEIREDSLVLTPLLEEGGEPRGLEYYFKARNRETSSSRSS